MRAQGLHYSCELGGGRDVRDDDAASGQRVGHHVDALPGREHVQHYPIHAAGLLPRRQALDEVSDGERPCRVGQPVGIGEELCDVAARHVRELLTALV